MGRFTAGANHVIQNLIVGSEIFPTPVFWQNNLYIGGVGGLIQFAFIPATGMFNPVQTSLSSTTFRFPGATPSLSSTGATSGIVWALDNSQFCTRQSIGCGPAVLHAYDATNLGRELWNSSQAAANRDQAGDAVKFTVPTIANGKVYTRRRGNNTTVPGELEVYGLLPN